MKNCIQTEAFTLFHYCQNYNTKPNIFVLLVLLVLFPINPRFLQKPIYCIVKPKFNHYLHFISNIYGWNIVAFLCNIVATTVIGIINIIFLFYHKLNKMFDT